VGLMRQAILLLVELFLISFSTVLALVLRDNFEISEARFADLAHYLVFTLAVAGVVMPAFETNRSVLRFTTMVTATVAMVAGGVALGGVRILMRWRHAARERRVQLVAAKGTADCETVLVVGLGRPTRLYLRSVAQFAGNRVRIAGFLGLNDRHTGRSVQGHSVLGTPEHISDILRDLEIRDALVDRIVVATAFEKLSTQAQDALLDIETPTNISLEFLIVQMGLGLRSRGRAESDSSSAGVLIVLAPFMLFVAILAAIDVGLPVTFWEQRPSLNGRRFKLCKFYTMAATLDASGQRVPDDERTSGVGRFLRRTRLDELPQLFNILSGDMSFVGPRPLLPIDQPAAYAARLLVRPGLTGCAQVKGGREISAADKAALDVWYVRNASLALGF
jgi:lipopolysaccharide/colanic/teichoic acid biosynthesis glycosyltransferase